MKHPELFTDLNDETSNAIEDIARFVGADPFFVGNCMVNDGSILDETPSHMDAVKEATNSLNEAARHAQNLLRSMTQLTPAQHLAHGAAGCVTTFQLEHLAYVLADDTKDLKEWSRNRQRTGGRNLAAYGVAKSIRRLFRRLRKEITFGQHPDGGPSTEFGKTVQYAIGAFGIKADWRRPTQEEREVQRKINERYYRIAGTRPKPLLLGKPDCVTITLEKEGDNNSYVFRSDIHQDLDPHRVCACRFKSGAEVKNYAAVWFSGLSANS